MRAPGGMALLRPAGSAVVRVWGVERGCACARERPGAHGRAASAGFEGGLFCANWGFAMSHCHLVARSCPPARPQAARATSPCFRVPCVHTVRVADSLAFTLHPAMPTWSAGGWAARIHHLVDMSSRPACPQVWSRNTFKMRRPGGRVGSRADTRRCALQIKSNGVDKAKPISRALDLI